MRRIDKGTAGPAKRQSSSSPSLASRTAVASKPTPRSRTPSPSAKDTPRVSRPALRPSLGESIKNGRLAYSPRRQRIEHLIDSAIYGWKNPTKIGAEFQRMNLTPEESRYVSHASSRRGERAIHRAAQRDVGDIAHAVTGAGRQIGGYVERTARDRAHEIVHPSVGRELHRARRGTELVTGIDPADPLKHGPYWLAANAALLGAPLAGRAAGVSARAGARALESAAARKAIGRLAEERGAIRFRREIPPEEPPPPKPNVVVPGAEKPPRLPTTGGVREALPGAERARAAQDIGYSAARRQKFAEQKRIFDAEIARGTDPRMAHRIAKRALAGELPKVEFAGMQHFSEEQISQRVGDIYAHPALTQGQKTRAADAIESAVKGVTPQPSQIAILKQVFGEEEIAKLESFAKAQDERSLASKIRAEVAAAPRTLQSTADVSYLLRQSLVAGARHPLMWAKSIGPSLRAAGKEGYRAAQEELGLRESFDEATGHGLSITEVGGGLEKGEEAYMGQYLTKVKGISHAGHAYTYFLNKMRLDMWDLLKPQVQASAEAAGRDVDKALDDLGRYINGSTGRGTGGAGRSGRAFEAVAPAASNLFFSPRLLKSRFDFLNPAYYVRLDPAVRKEALRAAGQTVAAGMAVLGAASQIPGVSVGMNPLSANFGRIRIGNTRIDLWGGFQPVVRLYSQMVMGAYVASTSGRRFSLKKGGFGSSTRYDILQNFTRSKFAPWPGMVADYFDKQDITGQPFRWRDQWQNFIPMMLTDVHDVYVQTKGTGAPTGQALGAGAGAFGLSQLGVGVLSYGDRGPAQSELDDVMKRVKQYGLRPPGQITIDQIKAKTEYHDKIVSTDSYTEKMKLQAAEYEKQHPGEDTSATVNRVLSLRDKKLREAEAKRVYRRNASLIRWPDVEGLNEALHAAEDKALDQKLKVAH